MVFEYRQGWVLVIGPLWVGEGWVRRWGRVGGKKRVCGKGKAGKDRRERLGG
jgi:hypothetical protein